MHYCEWCMSAHKRDEHKLMAAVRLDTLRTSTFWLDRLAHMALVLTLYQFVHGKVKSEV